MASAVLVAILSGWQNKPVYHVRFTSHFEGFDLRQGGKFVRVRADVDVAGVNCPGIRALHGPGHSTPFGVATSQQRGRLRGAQQSMIFIGGNVTAAYLTVHCRMYSRKFPRHGHIVAWIGSTLEKTTPGKLHLHRIVATILYHHQTYASLVARL